MLTNFQQESTRRRVLRLSLRKTLCLPHEQRAQGKFCKCSEPPHFYAAESALLPSLIVAVYRLLVARRTCCNYRALMINPVAGPTRDI